MALAPGQVALTSCRLGRLRLDAGRLNALLAPPTVPHTPTPAHGSAGGPYTLAWIADAAASYDVYFGTSPAPPLVSSAQPGQSYTLPPLTAGTPYFWRIVARNSFGTTPGPTWSFTAAVPSVAPSNPSPAHGATDVPNGPPTLTWTGPLPPEPGSMYHVYFGPSGSSVLVAFVLVASWTPPSPLANQTTYVWRVEAVNNAGPTSGATWTFTTWTLGAASSPSPAHGATLVSVSTNLSWAAALHATGYDVYVGQSPSGLSLASSNQPGLVYDPPTALGADTTYYWRITARNVGGTTPGPIWSFTTTDPTKPIIIIDGVTPHMRIAGLRIQDQLNDRPNTCTFVVDTNAVHVGSIVQIGLGSLAATDLLFAGTIDAVEQVYEGDRPALLAWRVTCLDWWRRLNRTKVLQHYAEQSATAIATSLVSTYSSGGFTTSAIQAGLPTVSGGIDFTNEDLGLCLRRLMTKIGGYWYVDYGKGVHAFLTETTVPPDALVPGLRSLLNDPSVTRDSDLSQIRTRVFVQGGGSNTTVDIAAGQPTIPIEDASWFNPAGGTVTTGTQRIPHTGTVAGGGGSTVRGSDGPTGSAPVASLSTTVGGLVGATNYRVSFKNSAGETVPGASSGTVTGVAVSPPPSGPSIALAGGLGRIVGTNLTYRLTYVTALGETTYSLPSTPVSPAAPAAPGTLTIGLGTGVGWLIGAYSYRLTFVTAQGETEGGAIASRTATAVTAPASPAVDASVVNGPLLGTYQWRVSYLTADGREALGTPTVSVSAPVTTAAAPFLSGDGTGNKIDIRVAWFSPYGESAWSAFSTDANHGAPVMITPQSFPSDATGWIAFSSGSYTASSPGTFFRMPDVYIGSGTAQLGTNGVPATGAAGTMGRKAQLSSIPTGPSGTVARRIYRTKAGGSDFFLVAEIPNNTATSYLDVVPDSALTQAAPYQNLLGQVHALTGIPTGPTGTVARRLYRTLAGGSDYRLLVELPNNTTTTYTDNTPDGTLGEGTAPLVNTAGGQNVAVTVLAGPAGTIARRVYRTKTGGASGYFFVGELSDNTSTAFLDDRLDAELGQAPPLVNTAGASAVNLSSIPIGGASITARRVYRLDLAGIYRFVLELKDNTTTTALDKLADTELGDVAPTVSTIGALPGATTLLVESTAAFRAAGGWVTSGSQHIRYTGLSGSTLTGIPASGPGSLVSPLKAGDEVIAEALITGTVIAEAIGRGETLSVWVQKDDTAAQSELAALEGAGSTGIYEHVIVDTRLTWKEAEATAAADLKLFARPILTIRYASRDPKTVSGKTVHIALPSLDISGDFTIQTVTIDQIGIAKGLYPRYTVEASSIRWTFEDLLRQVLLAP